MNATADAPSTELATARMGGRRKAAILLITLGPERAAAILEHLDDEEVEALSSEMARIRQVTPETSQAILDELAEHVTAPAQAALGGLDYTYEVLEKRFGRNRAQEIVDALAGKMQHKPFDFLRRTPPEQVAAFLQEEAPQTIAIVIASLPSSIAAKVLAELPKDLQGDVALRIAMMSETNPLVVRDLEAALKEKLSAILDQELVGAGGVQSLAEILNQAGRTTERHVLQAMADHDQVLAEEVRQRIFTFDDIVTLSDRDIQILLRDVDQKDLAIALRGVDDRIKDKILNNLSQRGAEMLREDMEVMPPQRKAVIDEAQSKIVRAARVLDDAGTITIRQSDTGEDEVV
ncbi:MAG: flagellar motor switch protein FliG [Solirubrobacteraceae bacterium]|jgi:flagellar motor switch protein FliG|nr:flagellar motor switch protein FliG [Solirubrobacteraceae bacterium]